MRLLDVYSNEIKAGTLVEEVPAKSYVFTYDKDYIASTYPAISLTLPKKDTAYKSMSLFPFFTNLLPEGANRRAVCKMNRIDEQDFFGMLMQTVGTDMIGAIHFKLVENERN